MVRTLGGAGSDIRCAPGVVTSGHWAQVSGVTRTSDAHQDTASTAMKTIVLGDKPFKKQESNCEFNSMYSVI